MMTAIEQLYALFPKETLKTFTSDRGKEFACYPLVEKLGINFYFADAYLLGKEEVMKMSMAYLENIFLRRLT